MNFLMIGAHPDDCDFRCSGLAALYVKAGHRVKFLSMCDGSGGHQVLNRNEIAARRWNETREAAKVIGIEYDVWNIPDCEIVNDLQTRARLVRYIRAFNPDVVFCHRTNDYHADHRASGLLVQDASYLLIVPNYCEDSPAMRRMPVIMYFYDAFNNPPFIPDIVIDTDSTVEYKFRMADKHVSQIYEWLPYTEGTLDEIPADPAQRFKWLHGSKITLDSTDEEVLAATEYSSRYSRRYALAAALYRNKLIERYGEERGRKIRFAEAYAVSEYGSKLSPEREKILFPF